MPYPSEPPWRDHILGEEYKLWSSSLCSFLQPPVTSSLFGSNIILNTLFSNTLSLCSFRRQSFTPIQNHRQNYNFVYSHFYVYLQHTDWKITFVITSIISMEIGLKPMLNIKQNFNASDINWTEIDTANRYVGQSINRKSPWNMAWYVRTR
jgi:hypothetical protein